MAADGATFHFVSNNGLPLRTGRISATGRSFVTKKIRAQSSWSTKSDKPLNKRKLKSASRGSGVVSLGRPAQCRPCELLGRKSTHTVANCEHRPTDTEAIIAFHTSGSLPSATPAQPGFCMGRTSDRDVWTLLTYFESVICPQLGGLAAHLAPEQIRNSWILPSVTNLAFMHALLAFTALQVAVNRPELPFYVTLAAQQKVLALQALRRGLEDPTHAASNENIGAVYHLICFEETLFLPSRSSSLKQAFQPDYTQLMAHITGLKQMLGLRRGVQALTKNQDRSLRSFLLRHLVSRSGFALETKLVLPRNLLKQLYNYPNSSAFFADSTRKFSKWRSSGLQEGLSDLLTSTYCLLNDTSAWLQQPDRYEWDLLDLQGIYPLVLEIFPRWRYEKSQGASPADSLTALFAGVLLYFMSNNANLIECLPMPMVIIRDQLKDPTVWPALRAAELDLWLAFLLVLSSNHMPDYKDHFFNMHTEVLEAHQPTIRSVDEYLDALHSALWVPLRLDDYARQLWDKTMEALAGLESGRSPVQSPKTLDFGSRSANPYMNNAIRQAIKPSSPLASAY